MLGVRLHIGKAKASGPLDGFIPNPKLKLLDQLSEVMRFRHYSLRTETTYREWIKRFILFHGKRHPREMGAPEVQRFLSHPGSEPACRCLHAEPGVQRAAVPLP